MTDISELDVHFQPHVAVREKRPLTSREHPRRLRSRVVFRVMNAELNNMRCQHATFTADMPPDGFNIRQPVGLAGLLVTVTGLLNCSSETFRKTPLAPSLTTLYRARCFNREFFSDRAKHAPPVCCPLPAPSLGPSRLFCFAPKRATMLAVVRSLSFNYAK